MVKKICFTSLGCVRNLVDSEVMMGTVLKEGYQIEPNLKRADFHVVNTCGFLKEARDEAFAILDEIFQNKKKSSKVIVTGCMVNLFSDELKRHFPDIFFLLSAGNLDQIVKAIESQEKAVVIDQKSFLENRSTDRLFSTPSNFAYLKISEGCIKSCSYCLIPKIKGKLRSKPISQVLEEFKNMLDKNIYEIILIAQDLGDYAKDLKIKNGLEKLLIEILKIKRDFRIRLLYIYPDTLTDSLIDIIASNDRIYKYVDIPLQHINDKILKAMKRNICKEKILQLIDKLKSQNIVIRTTFIVGFPGESEKIFGELKDFVKSAKLDRVGIFKYSNEKGTHSFDMEDQISDEIKEKRYKKLHEIQEKIITETNKKKVGKKIEVYIEKYHPDSNLLLIGRDQFSAPEIDPYVIINDQKNFKGFGQRHLVKITGYVAHDLIGTIIS